MKKYIIITTINEKTKAISAFERKEGWHIVVVGDRKSKQIENSRNLTFLSIEEQQNLGFTLVDKTPFNHYSRKNIGYLYAIREGADVIYDTDDDNTPYPDWKPEQCKCDNFIKCQDDYANIYNYFTRDYIWPRGFPLDRVRDVKELKTEKSSPVTVGIWQGLVDLEPDVDAVYRLIFNKPVKFGRKEAVALPTGTFCPFNSQNTLWSRAAFPFLYLPATTSFRFTDILRGFIAQPMLWAAGMHLGFHQATVYQERNQHDVMVDFRDEIECFLNIRQIVEVLQGIDFSGTAIENLALAYRFLHENRFIGSDELLIVDAWLNDLNRILPSQ